MKRRIKKTIGIIIAMLILVINYSPYVQSIKNLPNELIIPQGQVHQLNIKLPLNVEIESDNVNVLKFNGNSLKDQSIYNMNETVKIEPELPGKTSLNLKLFGLITLKHLTVNVNPEIKLYPGGNSIGVYLYTKGALIVGSSNIINEKGEVKNPAVESGLRPGDIILSVNKIEIEDAVHLSTIINNKNNRKLELEVKRGNSTFITNISPVLDSRDKKYRLGIWVRDSTAGVGTMTFYDDNKNHFGALGHAITDVDTGTLLSVKDGEIMQSEVIEIKQGKKGEPGELKGVFSENRKVIGDIVRNTKFGIYGTGRKRIDKQVYNKSLPVAYQNNVKTGKATILTTIDDKGIREFNIEIMKINYQTKPNAKGMILRITDEELLNKTGGIVQGMSGSPIIQNNKIIGAVTHVFVNDPTKGYGIFIEWMLDESDKVIE